MSPKEKIAKLFHSFTVRYGELELKQGQQLTAIERSWVLSVGRYGWSDIMLAMKQWFQTAKYAKWPEEGQMLEILRQFDCKPEPEQQHQPAADWQEAERLSGAWYQHLIRQPAEASWWLQDRLSCLDALLTRYAIGNGPDEFRHRLARAWQSGALQPAAWELFATGWRVAAAQRTAAYKAEIGDRGIMRTHERRAPGRVAA